MNYSQYFDKITKTCFFKLNSNFMIVEILQKSSKDFVLFSIR